MDPDPNVKTDWEILCLVATAMGYPMHYNNTEEIWDEMISLSPKYYGATYEKWKPTTAFSGPATLATRKIRVQNSSHEGATFNKPEGKGHFYFFPFTPVKEKETEEFPLSLSTVREVGHYSVRTMTG